MGSSRGRGRPRKLVPSSPVKQVETPTDKLKVDEGGSKGSGKAKSQNVAEETEENRKSEAKGVEHEGETNQQKLWVDVINGNRMQANGMEIEFVAPTIMEGEVQIEIDYNDIRSEVNFWENSLFMYVIGKDPSMNGVKQFMLKFWNFVQTPELFYNDEGYFIMKFRSGEDRDLVMMKGPYTIQNMPMLLRIWHHDFCLKRDMLRTVPVWVKLPQLPLYLWGKRSLSKIGSALGKPLFTDECTAAKLRVSYARILVEIDVTQKIAESINIKDNEGRVIKQPVELEWKPLYCEVCKRAGHKCTPGPQKKTWTAKPNMSQEKKDETIVTKEKKMQGGGAELNTKAKEDEGWIEAKSSRIEKGKKPMKYTEGVECHNEFSSLGVLNDHLVDIDLT
ncbi:uncharacterized protein LOC131649881 [Vicia villosa]|uniref:uncharacterized protein LOC131649881 n=1 Tax=Vicia villosa TaxID=3911 RepID=UPI00273AD1DD|nr:uncharacterized protein LOC131649881 [Vicia villosa]